MEGIQESLDQDQLAVFVQTVLCLKIVKWACAVLHNLSLAVPVYLVGPWQRIVRNPFHPVCFLEEVVAQQEVHPHLEAAVEGSFG